MVVIDNARHTEAIHAPSRVGFRAVQIWLLVIAVCVFAMVLVGGATRLTGSGLSITEWQPIMGAIPPLDEVHWQDAFDKYRRIPQYERVNKGMTLAEFKTIYWWEWGHRFLGRMIGFIFLVPFVFFLWRRAIPRPFVPRIALLFVLGGSQGLLGWLMVKSGLTERVDVSQFRLAAHLGLAVAIGGFALWLAMSLGSVERAQTARLKQSSRRDAAPRGANAKDYIYLNAVALTALVYMQIIMGAFVAGLKAGHVSDTWPLMLGTIVPEGLGGVWPWYLSPFEDPLTAHFIHRVMGYIVAVAAIVCAMLVWRSYSPGGLSTAPLSVTTFAKLARNNSLTIPIACVIVCLIAQIALGVATVVYAVPLPFALAHQANAAILFALALWFLHRVYAARA